jgi:putative sigma-54 modulation protein
MKLQIVPKNNVVLSKTIEEYARKRVGKLDRYLSSITEGKLEIYQQDTKLPEQRFTVQVTLDSKGILIRAQEKAGDIRVAIDKVMDAITNRVERYKGKLYDKGRGISLARQGATIETEEVEAAKKVVKTKHFLIKPMFQDEAVSQMELLGHDFFIFINADNDKLNLLYRRKDGDYGLIEPEMK